MSWLAEHRESERLAAAAHETLQHGDAKRAQDLFVQAAVAERRALDCIGPDKPRTLGITAVSAVSLLYKAGRLDEAEQLAHGVAASSGMPSFALAELRALLQTIWYEQAQTEAGISSLPGQVIVSIKGGEVIAGGAPLDLILGKVQIIEKMFFRIAEFLKSLPLRKKGSPSREIQELCRLWLFQTVPGSYQFIVALRKPFRPGIFPADDPEPETLTNAFLSIVRAAGGAPDEELRTFVPNDDYREAFMKMTRDLAPGDKVFDQMEIRGAGDHKPIVLSASSRKLISEKLRSSMPLSVDQAKEALLPVGQEEATLRGVLRAVDLDKGFLEVVVNGERKQVTGVGEVVDDLIGPMVNHEVRVRVRRGKHNILTFIAIEQEE